MRKVRLTAIALLVLITVTLTAIIPLSLSAAGASHPSPTQAFYANDFAGVLESDTKQYIARAASSLESRTSAQRVVVTVNDLGGEALEDYSLSLFRAWGIGSADKNNGVLILLDIGGRQSRIEVGYGLEGALPDGKTGRIQDTYMLPYFRQNDFDQGVRQGFNALLGEIYAEYGLEVPADAEAPVEAEAGQVHPLLIILGSIAIAVLFILDFKFTGGIFTFMLLRVLFRSGKSGGGGSARGGGGSAGGGGSSRRW